MTEIRHGNKNRRNLYVGPTEQDHFAVTVGPIEHAAAVSGWLADAAKAWEAAGHPMPQPPSTAEVDRCGQHVTGTSSNRCLRPEGHAGGCSDEFEDVAAERDLLLWLHAEAAWQRDQAAKTLPPDMVRGDYYSPDEVLELHASLEDERDQLQAEVDRLRAELEPR